MADFVNKVKSKDGKVYDIQDKRVPEILASNEGQYLKVEDGAIVFTDLPGDDSGKKYSYKHELTLKFRTLNELNELGSLGREAYEAYMENMEELYGSIGSDTPMSTIEAVYGTEEFKELIGESMYGCFGSDFVMDYIGFYTGAVDPIKYNLMLTYMSAYRDWRTDERYNFDLEPNDITLTVYTNSATEINLDNIKDIHDFYADSYRKDDFKAEILKYINAELAKDDEGYIPVDDFEDLKGSAALMALMFSGMESKTINLLDLGYKWELMIGSGGIMMAMPSICYQTETDKVFPAMMGSGMLIPTEAKDILPYGYIKSISDTVTKLD